MTIYDYFERELGRSPDDASLRQLPLDSNCGDDCKGAIDAAKGLLFHSQQARGYDPDLRDFILNETHHIVQIYWRG